jgi:hypothetical protein
MKKFLLLTAVMISFFYISEKANAGSIVEPYAGALLNSTYSDDNSVKGDITGTTVGARVGFSQMGFMAGLDGRRIFSNYEPETGADSDYTFSQLGFFVGYEMPIMLRFWGEYVFSFEGVDDDDSENKIKKGSGMLFGVGYAFLPFVSVNLEMSNIISTQYADSSGTSDFDMDHKSWVVSISIPLHL